MAQPEESNEQTPMTVDQLYIEKGAWLTRHAEQAMSARLRREHDPREVVHEVFADFLASPRDFRVIRSIDTYLRNALDNKISQLVRRQRAQKRDARRQLTGETLIGRILLFMSGQWKTPSSEVAVREARDRVESAINKLDTDDRGIAIEQARGASQQDIARRRGLTAAAVNGRLFRIKKALRTLLGIDRHAD